jgi:hypothetical protein
MPPPQAYSPVAVGELYLLAYCVDIPPSLELLLAATTNGQQPLPSFPTPTFKIFKPLSIDIILFYVLDSFLLP